MVDAPSMLHLAERAGLELELLKDSYLLIVQTAEWTVEVEVSSSPTR